METHRHSQINGKLYTHAQDCGTPVCHVQIHDGLGTLISKTFAAIKMIMTWKNILKRP